MDLGSATSEQSRRYGFHGHWLKMEAVIVDWNDGLNG